jgi:hypothetical protein
LPYQPRNVDCKTVKPLVTELILRCGSPEKASAYCGVGTSTFYRIRHNEHCTLQKATAEKIISALKQKRIEDRAAGQVSNELIEKLKKQAITESQAFREDRLGRLSGY